MFWGKFPIENKSMQQNYTSNNIANLYIEGAIIEAGKHYTENVVRAFHVSQACLDTSHEQEEKAKIWLVKGENQYLLACLSNSSPNSRLDLAFAKGDNISFFTQGTLQTVYLTGFFVPDVLSDSFR